MPTNKSQITRVGLKFKTAIKTRGENWEDLFKNTINNNYIMILFYIHFKVLFIIE